ncbi:hypothetical protein BGLT_05818 [Caballeronia glathei]|jgi:hypothetical protein|nr:MULTISPECIES: hypothetical protein [Burkholderiaceae]TCK36144.1 hypothetical protein B0G84_5124 [Paraburkholderia sp. BL8N3]CDY76733.1 hypothetical protein BGLT_05818 [Caballeronia glathei]
MLLSELEGLSCVEAAKVLGVSKLAHFAVCLKLGHALSDHGA